MNLLIGQAELNALGLQSISSFRKTRKETIILKKNICSSQEFVEYDDFKAIIQHLRSRLDFTFYQEISEQSTINSLDYLYSHIRVGVLVIIRNNEIKLFIPFENVNYLNNWKQKVKFEEENLTQYLIEKDKNTQDTSTNEDLHKWWIDGCFIHNEDISEAKTEDLLSLKEMIEVLCKERSIPDVDFFINRTNHPVLKSNLTEPFDYMFNEHNIALERCKHESFCPIFSFQTNNEYADLSLPTVDDWKESKNTENYNFLWGNKIETLLFRGSSFGPGSSTEKNQRLKAAELCYEWASTGVNCILESDRLSVPAGIGLLLIDAGITNFDSYNRKYEDLPMSYIKRDDFIFDESNYMTKEEQEKYKYLLYIEGNGASKRYSSLMKLNSVIFKVESTSKANNLWYFTSLIPYKGNRTNNIDVEQADHILIKEDFSNLREMIIWCKENDLKCQQIVANTQKKYNNLLKKDSILDFLQVSMVEMSRNILFPPDFFVYPEILKNEFKGEKSPFCAKDQATNTFKYCRGCRERQLDYENKRLKRRKVVNSVITSTNDNSNIKACRKCRKLTCTCVKKPTLKKLKIKLGNKTTEINLKKL